MTQLLISEQQWAGGDRFAKTNNLISGSTALISSAQNSLDKTGENHNITSTVIMSGLYLAFTLKGEGSQLVAEDCWYSPGRVVQKPASDASVYALIMSW